METCKEKRFLFFFLFLLLDKFTGFKQEADQYFEKGYVGGVLCCFVLFFDEEDFRIDLQSD